MDALPPEIITQIFSYSNTDELIKLSKISTYFYNIINNDASLLLRMNLDKYRKSEEFKRIIRSRYCSVLGKSFSLQNCFPDDRDIIDQMLIVYCFICMCKENRIGLINYMENRYNLFSSKNITWFKKFLYWNKPYVPISISSFFVSRMNSEIAVAYLCGCENIKVLDFIKNKCNIRKEDLMKYDNFLVKSAAQTENTVILEYIDNYFDLNDVIKTEKQLRELIIKSLWSENAEKMIIYLHNRFPQIRLNLSEEFGYFGVLHKIKNKRIIDLLFCLYPPMAKLYVDFDTLDGMLACKEERENVYYLMNKFNISRTALLKNPLAYLESFRYF